MSSWVDLTYSAGLSPKRFYTSPGHSAGAVEDTRYTKYLMCVYIMFCPCIQAIISVFCMV